MFYFWYFLASFVGIMVGLLGGWGSILAVPLLVYVFGVDPVLATSYSLWLIGVSSLIAVIPKYMIGQVKFTMSLLVGIPSILWVLLVRQVLLPLIPEVFVIWGAILTRWFVVMMVFAVVMFFSALSLLSSRPSADQDDLLHRSPLVMTLMWLLIGWLAWFVGAGWWFLIIPLLVFFTKIPIKKAIGTSLLIVAIQSLFGFIGDVVSGVDIDWTLMAIIVLISILGMFVGHYIHRYTHSHRIQTLFGYIVLCMSIVILVEELLF